jgi:hypothetical protein
MPATAPHHHGTGQPQHISTAAAAAIKAAKFIMEAVNGRRLTICSTASKHATSSRMHLSMISLLLCCQT